MVAVTPPVRDSQAHRDGASVTRGERGLTRRYDFARWVLTNALPMALLGSLALAQGDDALRNGASLARNPNWLTTIEVTRESFYACFLLGAASVLATRKDPRRCDSRGLVAAASLTASFLLVAACFVPAGPVAWRASIEVSEIGLMVTLVGAALALGALTNLGANFSIVPEARSLVVTGPYRWLRHPMYFAELLMIVGFAVGGLRVTALAGAMIVFGLQVYRIRVEERLLMSTFPRAYERFVSRTRYRLIPLIW
jgi:protein-S-isoprenylcysteine O-methyltransferase Ste14